MSKIESIAVLGGGTWGCTLANILAGNGHKINLWEFDPEVAKKLENERVLKTLPGFNLNQEIKVSNQIDMVLDGKDIIISVTPSHTVRPTFSSSPAHRSLKRGAMVVSASKGIEKETNLTMSYVIREMFTKAGDIVILSGPSHAEEVAKGMPVALVAASKSQAAQSRVRDLFSTPMVRVYTSDDPLGVELGGALKNVYALAGGVTDGLGLGDNTKAALITRGLAEITRLGVKMDCRPLTFFGLTGLGDLIVTCNSRHSRNRRLGELLGQGHILEQALRKMTMVAEGVNTTLSAHSLAMKLGVETPIINEMYNVLFKNKSPKDSLADLMGRQVGSEMEGIVL